MSGSDLSPQERSALLDLLAVCSTVFEDGFLFRNEKAKEMALRRIQKSTLRCVTAFSDAPTFGAGRG